MRGSILGSSQGTRMAVAGVMRVFRACPLPTAGCSAACRGQIPGLLENQDSLPVRKNAGNSSDSAVFFENPSRKATRIQPFADEFPTQSEQGIFLPAQGFNSREEGMNSAKIRSARPT